MVVPFRRKPPGTDDRGRSAANLVRHRGRKNPVGQRAAFDVERSDPAAVVGGKTGLVRQRQGSLGFIPVDKAVSSKNQFLSVVKDVDP
jgi:hypothetical protein